MICIALSNGLDWHWYDSLVICKFAIYFRMTTAVSCIWVCSLHLKSFIFSFSYFVLHIKRCRSSLNYRKALTESVTYFIKLEFGTEEMRKPLIKEEESYSVHLLNTYFPQYPWYPVPLKLRAKVSVYFWLK